MRYGDIEGKGKVYSESGDPILTSSERLEEKLQGMLHRGWVRYKLGWRTIMFKGYGIYNLTNSRIIYIEKPEYIEKIHTFNLDHELGDFGGWDYHAHRLRRAARLNAYIFFDIPYSEITKFKLKNNNTIFYSKDKSDRYKIVVENKIGTELESMWRRFKTSN